MIDLQSCFFSKMFIFQFYYHTYRITLQQHKACDQSQKIIELYIIQLFILQYINIEKATEFKNKQVVIQTHKIKYIVIYNTSALQIKIKFPCMN